MKKAEAVAGTKTGSKKRPLSPRVRGQQRAAITAIFEAPSGAAAEREYDAATRFDSLTEAEKRAVAKRQRPEPEPASDSNDEEEDADEAVIERAQKEARAKRAAAKDAEPEPEPEPKKQKLGRGGNARRNLNLPQSKHAGVIWFAKGKKWRGTVINKLQKTASGWPKKEYTAYFPADQEEACAQALEALRARLDGEYWEEMERRAAADPRTRDLPRGPDDAADAEERVVYWRPNYKNGHTPYRAVRGRNGKQGAWAWLRACVECATIAVQVQFGGGISLYCAGHLPSADRCPHGTALRSNCQICRAKDAKAAGKTAAGKLAYLCARCQDTKLALKRRVSNRGNGLCAPCEERVNEEAREAGAESLAPAKGKSWEDLCLDMLADLVPQGIEMRDEMTQMIGKLRTNKRRVRAGRCSTLGGAADHDCDTTKQRRPDLLYVLRHPETGRMVCCIVVEIDEHSHSRPNYPTSCELGRCDDLFQALSIHAQREGFVDDRAGHARRDAVHPIVYVLKLNPNACNATPKTLRLEDRIQTLANRINAIFGLPRQELVDAVQRNDPDTLVPRVELFYYHTKHAAHHIRGYEEAHAQGSLIYAGNVVS